MKDKKKSDIYSSLQLGESSHDPVVQNIINIISPYPKHVTFINIGLNLLSPQLTQIFCVQ